MIRRCPSHGYFDGERCDCGSRGDAVIDEDRRVRLSKFLSGALRHFPEDAGRHAEPVVFEVEASSVEVTERGDGVYAVDSVPPEALSLL